MRKYFKGWYYKIQNEQISAAFIPSLSKGKSGDATASIQVITSFGSWNIEYSDNEFVQHRNGSIPSVTVGNSFFSTRGMSISINSNGVNISGRLTFCNRRELGGDIMGPFRYVPFMECRHHVLSMYHEVSGELTINGRQFVFVNSPGYIEGDEGRSFPREYAWTQFMKGGTTPVSIMLSVADIPISSYHFIGVIGFVLCGDKEYRIATYRGAKAVLIDDGRLTVWQNDLCLTAELIERSPSMLNAPASGSMVRKIREDISCRAGYSLRINNDVIFKGISDRASFEYEFKS